MRLSPSRMSAVSAGTLVALLAMGSFATAEAAARIHHAPAKRTHSVRADRASQGSREMASRHDSTRSTNSSFTSDRRNLRISFGLPQGMRDASLSGDARGTGHFYTDGTKIIDPAGQQFVVKGVAALYGTFVGGDPTGYGQTSYEDAAGDFIRLKSMGVNTIRIMVTAANDDPTDLSRLDNAVSLATSDGLVVELSNAYDDATSSISWISLLAQRYADNPYVWINPMNEPECDWPASGSACGSWTTWQSEEKQYIAAIRNAGMTSPIVIDGIYWSWDLGLIQQYPLGDPNIIYAAHAYADNNTSFNASAQQSVYNSWASFATQVPVMVEEVGNYNGSQFVNSINWTQGFINYVTKWVQTGDGDGAIAFNWRWMDGNSLTTPSGALTRWGQIYDEEYLQAVRGS